MGMPTDGGVDCDGQDNRLKKEDSPWSSDGDLQNLCNRLFGLSGLQLALVDFPSRFG
jgi:hypothetical protein